MVTITNKSDVIGVFVGLESSTYEYIATIIAPYHVSFTLSIGDFLLIDNIKTRLVARVTEYRPMGELVSFMGQKWLGDVSNNLDAIGMDIKEKKIRYNVRIKILGTLESNKFKPGVTNLPHITSKVYKPSTEELKTIINAATEDQKSGDEIGSLYNDASIRIKFNVQDLNSKRTFIFARAGYGKSNLMKLISNSWPKGEGGLIIFDPEGEYAITGGGNKPGLMDSRPALLITNRFEDPSLKNVYKHLKLNFKDLDPEFIMPIIVNSAKHETVFFSKLMGISRGNWNKLVDLLYTKKWNSDLEEVAILVTGNNDTSNMQPVLNNLVTPIMKLHDPDSHLMDIIIEAMKREETLIIDISLLDSQSALQFSSLIVKYIFNHNQVHFTDQGTALVKTTFVIEEAQSVLGSNTQYQSFIELAKEGRKYKLGGIFITQQPGSIPSDILSQGDNFFVFHLLSRIDLESLKKSNAHYSEDILTQILSEPIPGKCYMWTSRQPFVLPVTIDNFEEKVKPNSYIEVQNRNNILSDMLKNISQGDEILQQIKIKALEIENQWPGDTSENTKRLYNKLTENEKEYLKQKGELAANTVTGSVFAVKTKFYNSLNK